MSAELVALGPEEIATRIRVLRGQRVLIDTDLARIYGVPTKRLNEQVKRNTRRFPEDFVFQLTREEAEMIARLRSQNATLKKAHEKWSQNATGLARFDLSVQITGEFCLIEWPTHLPLFQQTIEIASDHSGKLHCLADGECGTRIQCDGEIHAEFLTQVIRLHFEAESTESGMPSVTSIIVEITSIGPAARLQRGRALSSVEQPLTRCSNFAKFTKKSFNQRIAVVGPLRKHCVDQGTNVIHAARLFRQTQDVQASEYLDVADLRRFAPGGLIQERWPPALLRQGNRLRFAGAAQMAIQFLDRRSRPPGDPLHPLRGSKFFHSVSRLRPRLSDRRRYWVKPQQPVFPFFPTQHQPQPNS